MIDSTLEYLYQLHNRGIKLGLENINKILHECNNPHDKFKSIHLAGTNGKGSTASIIAKILQNAGQKVGLYTSPHLCLLYTSPSPRDRTRSRMPSSA